MPFLLNYIKVTIVFCLLNQASCISLKSKDDLQEFKDPCAQIKCASNQICIPRDDFTASCILREQVETGQDLFFNKRSIETNKQLCGNLECRFGVCEALNETNHICHCSKGVTGKNCNVLDTTQLPCSSNPCFGNSICINLGKQPICVCGAGLTGPECKDHISPCQCKNGGLCFQEIAGIFRCKCPEFYGGHLCQYSLNKTCAETGCVNGGICTPHGCHCLDGYSGSQCEILETTTIRTTVLAKKIRPNLNLCVPGICINGGSCLQLGANLAICICSSGFTGQYCQTPTEENTMSETETTESKEDENDIMKTCPNDIPNPCLNEGICNYSISTGQITCTCNSLYFGTFCEKKATFCSVNPCQNGGYCTNSLFDQLSGVCDCPDGFTGKFCEIGLSCNPNPCKHNQPCIVHNSKPKCFCGAHFSPPYCE